MSSGYRYLQPETARLERRIAALEAENDRLQKGLRAVLDLMIESDGVVGLHLNGDVAPWDELRQGGSCEAWLWDFDDALAGGSK